MTQLVGKIHKRYAIRGSTLRDEYGTGDAMCAGLIPVRQLRHSWRNVDCKRCLCHRPEVTK